MANVAQDAGSLPSAELWASHSKMLLEPLDSNDPEVRAAGTLISSNEGHSARLGCWDLASPSALLPTERASPRYMDILWL